MGIITLEKSNNLLWLGRYTERVHTTLKYYIEATDRMIDRDPGYYAIFCEKIGIPDIYGSREAFWTRYPFDTDDPNSIFSNLYRAYDNAIVMRDYIGTETMAYIQLAIDDMKNARLGEHLLERAHHALALVARDHPHAREPAALQPQQELPPRVL